MSIDGTKKLTLLPYVLAAVAAVVLFSAGGSAVCGNPASDGRLFVDGKDRVAAGYVLAAPYVSANNYEQPGEVLLLDERGRTVHSWHTRYTVMRAILEKNGNVFVAMTPPLKQSDYPSAGTTGILEELDWDGHVLWEYSDPNMTHDFELLPDGSVAYIKWDAVPNWFASSIEGGRDTATTTRWSNALVVVNKEKEVAWEWHAYEHLKPWDFVLPSSIERSDWSHMNSVRYTNDNPLTHSPAYLISSRNLSTVFLIDAKTGAVIWKSPDGLVSFQHDASFTDSGTILVFDNGVYNALTEGAVLLSRVIEIDPKTNAVTWEYDGGKTPTERTGFASSVMGGAQRLPNGNTLVTLSTESRVVEVTKEGKTVWEYLNTFRDTDGTARFLFKSRKYDSEETAWASRILPSALVSSLCSFR